MNHTAEGLKRPNGTDQKQQTLLFLHHSEPTVGGNTQWTAGINGKQNFFSSDPGNPFGSVISKKTLDQEKERKIRQCVIVSAAFCSHFCVCAFAYTIGVYFEEFLHVFRQSAGDTAWVGSLNFGILCLSGPVCSIVSDRFSCRAVVIAGGLIAAIGLVLSVFATSLTYLYVTFGIITGFGFGLSFNATVFVVGLAFTHRRALAMGVSISGVGAGMIVQPHLIEYLVHTYGWRGSLLIQAGMMLQSVIFGALMKLPEAKPAPCLPDCQEKVPETKPKVFDFGIFADFRYVALLANLFLFCLGMSIVLVHLPHVADTLSFSHDQSALLISIIGITNTVGRTVLGVIGNLPRVNATLLYGISYMISGLATIFYPSSNFYGVLVICSVIYGLFTAAYGSLLPDVVISVVGKHRFTAGYGMLSVFGGIGTILGAPMAGWLYDGFRNYQPSFYLGGGALILSGITAFIPWKFERCKLTAKNLEAEKGFLERESMVLNMPGVSVPGEDTLTVDRLRITPYSVW